MADLTEVFNSYTRALSQYNAEELEAGIPVAPAPVAVAAKASAARRFVNWMKRYLCCCCASSNAVEGVVEPIPVLPAPAPAAPTYSDYIPDGMIVNFDGKLVKPYNPASSDPCPHYLKTISMTTAEESCLNCGYITNKSVRLHRADPSPRAGMRLRQPQEA